MSGGNVERRGYTGISGRAKARERQGRDNQSRMDSIAAKTENILRMRELAEQRRQLESERERWTRELAKDRQAVETSRKQTKRSPDGC